MRTLLLASIALSLVLPRVSTADEQAEARAILGKAIKAQGDEAAMRKVVAVHAKIEEIACGLDIGILLRLDIYQQGRDKARTVTSVISPDTAKDVETEVVNGKVRWTKRNNEETKTASDADVAPSREDIFVGWIGWLDSFRKPEYRLSPIGETSIAGRKVIGILARRDKHGTFKLYFDKETYLPVKCERRFKEGEPAKDVQEETVLSDYRTVQRIKQPYRVELYRDGRKAARWVFLNLELSEKAFDDKLFSKP